MVVPKARLRRAPILVALEGPSAVGKSTVAAALARTLGAVPIAEAADRLDPRPSIDYRSSRELLALERRLLYEEARRFRAATALVLAGSTVVADTGFLGPVSYTAGLVAAGRAPLSVLRNLTRAAAELTSEHRLGLPDLTVYLSAGPRTLAARARRDTARHPEALRERHWSVGRFEDSVFRPWLHGISRGRVRSLRASGPPEEVVGRLVRLLRSSRTLSERCVPLGRALAVEAAVQGRPAASPLGFCSVIGT